MGDLLSFIAVFPYKEGCEGILAAFGRQRVDVKTRGKV